jgi:hypothetical protein
VVARLVTRGAVGSTLVLLGGLVTATLPRSTPLLHAGEPSEALLLLRGTTPGRMAGLALVLVGLGLLAASWLVLCRRLAVRRGSSGGVELVRMATLAWCAPLVLAPPLFSRDGWSYAAQGMLVTLDISPYTHGPHMLAGPLRQAVDSMWMQTPAPYGPLPLAFGGVAADLTASPWLLVIAHRGLALVGLGLLAWAVPRLARWAGADPALASALVLLSPFMLANGVAGLHNDLLMVGLMAAALVVAAERGWFWGAALAGLAAAVKAPGGLVCLGIVLVSLPAGARLVDRARRTGGVAAVSVGVLLGLGAATGLGAGWLSGLTVPAAVSTPLSLTTMVGTGLAGLTGAEVFHGLTRLVGGLGAFGIGGWLLLRGPTGRRDVALAAVGATVLAFVLLSPVVHLWYFLWAVPFLAARRLSRAAMTALVALSVVGGLVAPLDSSLHGAYLVIVFAVMLVAGLVALLLLTRTSRDRLIRISIPA